LYGFLYTNVRIEGGRFWCAACYSVSRTFSTSTLFIAYIKLVIKQQMYVK